MTIDMAWMYTTAGLEQLGYLFQIMFWPLNIFLKKKNVIITGIFHCKTNSLRKHKLFYFTYNTYNSEATANTVREA